MIYTVGHGNRSIEEFLVLLKDAGIECLVDVRAYPASRRHPQFARESLDQLLADMGVRYVWEGEALGGRRKLSNDSPHVALKNAGFRAYAGHMTTEEFRQALDRLVETGRGRRTAIMCAERLPWKCHRHLVADSLVARGVRVLHLMSACEGREHTLSRLAGLRGTTENGSSTTPGSSSGSSCREARRASPGRDKGGRMRKECQDATSRRSAP